MTNKPKKPTKSVPKLSYLDAAALTVSLGVRKRTELTELSRLNKRPPELPFQPDKYYEEYRSWRQFLIDGAMHLEKKGLGALTNKPPSFKELRSIIHELGIDSKNEFARALKKNKALAMVPRNIEVHYSKEFQGWDKLLKPKSKLLSYEDALVAAKEFAKSHEIVTSYQWANACKSGLKPNGLPVWPNKTYKAHWKSWQDFLGVDVNTPL